MYGYGYYRDARTDNERYLEDRVHELEAEREREREREREAREERQREWQEERETNLRTAKSWPEALSKQAYLMRREAHSTFMGKPTYDNDDDWFAPGAEACERALVIWKEVEAAKADQIKALEAQIQAIKDGIKLEVADRLEGESALPGWVHVADALRTEDPERWLDW